MKKFKTFLPLAFIGICSFVASTSCDSGDRSAEELSELNSILASQSRGFDPTVIANQPNGTLGLPFTLIPGDTITFFNITNGTPALPVSSRPNEVAFIVTAPNTLEQTQLGDINSPPGDESAFTNTWVLSNPTSLATSHSDATQAEISLTPQFTVEENSLLLPQNYADLFLPGRSLNEPATAYDGGDGELPLLDFNGLQEDALISLGYYAFADQARAGTGTEGDAGPFVRFKQDITLTITPGTLNSSLTVRNANGRFQVTGTYTTTQSYYLISNLTLAPDRSGEGEAIAPAVFTTGTGGLPSVRTATETGSFLIEFDTLTFP